MSAPVRRPGDPVADVAGVVEQVWRLGREAGHCDVQPVGAVTVGLNWRLAVPEQVFILTDASVKALVVEQGFAAVVEPSSAAPTAKHW